MKPQTLLALLCLLFLCACRAPDAPTLTLLTTTPTVPTQVSSMPIATLALPLTSTTWSLSRECESPDEATVGQMIWRSNASGTQVHGQFGTTSAAPWPVKSGHVQYNNLAIPELDNLFLELRYSKNTESMVPIVVSIDDETSVRAVFLPVNQGDWNKFAWTGTIPLGPIRSGVHSLKFYTPGQQYGVADLDRFVLSAQPAVIQPSVSTPVVTSIETPVSTMPRLPDSARIYFSAGTTLYRMKLDGSDLETLSRSLTHGEYLAADVPRHRLYISRWDSKDQLLVLDTDTGRLSVFGDGPATGNGGGQGLAIDAAANQMFSGLYYGGVFARGLTPGSDWLPVVLSVQLSPLLGQRGQIQIDTANRQVYFRSAFNGGCGECRYIWRVNYAGDDLIKILPANGGDALALDLIERKLYFSDVPGDATIKRANLDGSAVETVMTVPAPYDFCRSIVIDAARGKMYLSLFGDDNVSKRRAIARANLDGSGFEILFQLSVDLQTDVTGGLDLFLP